MPATAALSPRQCAAPDPGAIVHSMKKSLKILEAAKPLFLASGYTATSMDDVAAQAGVSKTTLYKRYPSKAALFAAVISAQTERSSLEWDTAIFAGNTIERPVQRIQWDPIQAEKGGYKHFMLKEIHEQPEVVGHTLARYVDMATGQVLVSRE